ncbi:MAG: hypothetical protein ACKPKO_53840 [Candidatus Fonsibacter sp.]
MIFRKASYYWMRVIICEVSNDKQVFGNEPNCQKNFPKFRKIFELQTQET